jgi:hypothetical protein
LAGTPFKDFAGTLFLKNSAGIPFFLQKEGEVYKKGAEAPLLRKKGAPTNFLRGSRLSFDTDNTDRVFLWYGIGMVNTEKYRLIPTEKYRLGMQLYKIPKLSKSGFSLKKFAYKFTFLRSWYGT